MASSIRKAESMAAGELAQYIDHSILRPEMNREEIERYAREGVQWGVATICANPDGLDIIAPIVQGTATGMSVVCDFPFGQGTPSAKEFLARAYCQRGDVTDLDLVINYGLVRSGNWEKAGLDIKAAIDVCRDHGVVSKVIIETDALIDEEIVQACEAVILAGADYVKTSTGFYTGGPTVGASREVIQKILKAVHGRIKVKASGNVRERALFLDLIDMGVDRIGLSYKSTAVALGAGERGPESQSGAY